MLFFSDIIETPATFTEDGVTARYVSKDSVYAELPAAVRDLVPAPAHPAGVGSS